jgi:nucleoside-diphosphate-sugar epimerase
VEFQSQGWEASVAQIADPATLTPELFDGVDSVLFAVGFDHTPGENIGGVYVEGLRNVLNACPPSVRRVIYISSTGVYGPSPGELVDENSPCHPTRDGGRACLAAEQLLQHHPLADRGVVLRLAGIYGPGRIPRIRDLQAGTPIRAAADNYLNLIHVEDAARIVLLADQRGASPGLYIVADGQPVRRLDFYTELARLTGCSPPRFETPSPEEQALTRGSDKRVSTARLQRELQPTLLFPSYREGLADVVRKS